MSHPTSSPTLVRLLRDRAQLHGTRDAFTFLRDGERPEEVLTYAALDHRARAIAAQLQARQARAGDRALLLYPSGIAFIAAFFGCLYAGVVPVPAYPPRPRRDDERLSALIADAGATQLLTTAQLGAAASSAIATLAAAMRVAHLLTDAIAPELADAWREPVITPSALAFLQYTSGSTARPRGVRVSHANLLHNQAMLRDAFGTSASTRVVSWLPLYHDMGLIGTVLHPLFVGGSGILMSPASFLQRPARWLRAIAAHRATVSGAPDFAYDLCARQIADEDKAGLDLSTWEVAFNGAEPVRAATLERFAEAFVRCGFRRERLHPCYGLAEATLFVSGGRPGDGPRAAAFDAEALEQHRVLPATRPDATATRTRSLVSCGRAWHDQQIALVDPDTARRVDPDEIGEIWLRGSSVADGYWNRPDESAAIFGARIAESDDGPFLRTGDLGFARDGELFITGRVKDLVIVRGRNHAPQDLELTVARCDPRLRPDAGAIFTARGDDDDAGGDDGGERLIVVQETTRRPAPDDDAVFEHVKMALARHHELRPDAIVLIRQGTIPRTSSGKIRRAACRDAYLAGRLDIVASWQDARPSPVLHGHDDAADGRASDALATLRAELAARLGVPDESLEADAPLVRHGLDSLAAIELAHRLEHTLGSPVSPAWLLDGASLTDIARLLDGGDSHTTPRIDAGADAGTGTGGRADVDARELVPQRSGAIPTADATDVSPLSPGERALYFLHQAAPDRSTYHIACAVRVHTPLDEAALRAALAALAARHPALRTTFDASHDGQPVRRVAPTTESGTVAASLLTIVRLPDADETMMRQQLEQAARRPFDLARGPLWRFRLLWRATDVPVLQLVVHHIVADLWSLTIVAEELAALYRAALTGAAADLPQARLAPWDYAAAANARLQADEGRRLESYWHARFPDVPAPLDLPTDRPRPPTQSGQGAAARLVLDATRTRALQTLAADEDATLQVVLLAAFQAVLSRYARQRDIIVGVPITVRRADESRLVGYCINTAPIRADLSDDPGFTTLLSRTRQAMLQALAHGAYPFDRLVARLHPVRDPARAPLVQAMFVLQQSPGRPDLAALALGEPDLRVGLGPLDVASVETPILGAPFDVTLRAAEWRGEIHLSLEYDTALFDADTATRLSRAIAALLEDATTGRRDVPISMLRIMPDAERHQLVDTWNDTAQPLDTTESLVQAISRRARRTPEAVALAFEDERRTFEAFERLTNRLAHRLQRAGVGPEVRVGLLMERSCELVEAVFAILKAGGVYVPLDPSYPRDRLAYMISDAGIRTIVTQHTLVDTAMALGADVLVWEGDAPPRADDRDDDPDVQVAGENLAYIIYTSGSTGEPKGAMNTHAGLKNRIAWMQSAYRLDASDGVLQKTPISFDVSIWELFLAPLAGARLVLARPGGHQDPAYLSTLIARESVTTIHFVPSMLDAFLREARLDACGSLRRVICSGEALSTDLQARFFARFDCELHNLYGPTEAAVDVTAWACRRDDSRHSVPIGHPIDNTTMHVLDPRGQPVPIGVPGQLFIGGINLARGYAGRPALTGDRFVPNPFGPPGSRLYRTGDVARYLARGEIEFLGRADHQVKVRGVRVELGEIEAALRRHPAVQEAIVSIHAAASSSRTRTNYRVDDRPQGNGPQGHGPTISRFFLKGRGIDEGEAPDDVARTDRLVAYIVHRPASAVPDAHAWRQFLGAWLTDAMMPHVFVSIPALPLLPNGKLDRRALPAPPRERPRLGTDYEAPENDTEAVLTSVWADVLGLDRVGTQDDFFALGGDSLRSLQVRALAQERGVDVTLPQIFEQRTPAALARVVRVGGVVDSDATSSSSAFDLIGDEDRRRLADDIEDAYPLSRVQAGIIYHLQLQPDSPVYHDVFVYRLRARFDEPALRKAVQDVVDRHPILRSSFDLARFAEPLQLVHRHVPAAVELLDWREGTAVEKTARETQWVETERHRRVDLAAPSQMRVIVQRTEDDVCQIVLSFFDMILDGWSTARLMTELVSRYVAHLRGAAPIEAPPPVSYRDFVAAERAAIASGALRAFWDRTLAGVEVTRLPRLAPRDADGRNALREVPIDRALSDGLWRAARTARLPLKHVLLAAHVRVLSVLAGRREVLTGLEANGRVERPGGDRCLGTHINTLPLRCQVGEQTWLALAQELFEQERALLPARRYPLFDLQKQYGREPLIDTAFNFTHFHVFEQLSELPEIEILGAWGFEETNFALRAEFNTNPFTGRVQLDLMAHLGELLPAQVEVIAGYYARALAAIAERPESRVRDTPLLDRDERQQVLEQFNAAPAAAAPAATLHAWVTRQARATPQAVAVEEDGIPLRYEELVRRAHRVAQRLHAAGVRPDDIVGLCAERSVDMVVAVLGILTAGAACLPLDPAYPADRLAYMARDAGARVRLAHAHLRARVAADGSGSGGDNGTAVILDLASVAGEDETGAPGDARHAHAWTPPAVSGDHLAYVIYTSGSTGTPKGVAMPHAPLVTLVAWQLAHSTGSAPARTLQFSPLSFDASFQEMFSTWVSGGTLVLIGDAARRDPLTLLRHLRDHRVERLFCPFVALKQLAETAERQDLVPVSLRHVLTAGEALEITPPLARLFGSALPEARLHNYYGPSETHVVTAYPLTGAAEQWPVLPPIGRPISHTQVYVLDEDLAPLPVGVAGELYVGGASLARGYLGRPDATAARFLPDPYAKAGGGRLYRTGDLARWLADGTLEFLGRADRQVKIRGFRVEPGEIESVLHEHPAVRQAVVIARREAGAHSRLIAYILPAADGEPVSVSALRGFLKQRFPDYMVPALFLPVTMIPLTPSGKIDRRALPEPPRDRADERRAGEPPRTPLEELIAGLFAELLGAGDVGRDEDFFELGGDSLLATQLVSRLGAALATEIPLRALFESPTVAALAAVDPRTGSGVPPAPPLRARGDADTPPPLSFAQQRMVVAAQTSAQSRAYSNPAVIELRGPLDVDQLERVLRAIIDRHDALRTVFPFDRGEASVAVLDGTPLDFRVEPRSALALDDDESGTDGHGDDAAGRAVRQEGENDEDGHEAVRRFARAEAERPFDLARGPLFRVTVVELDAAGHRHLAIVTLHHIVSDGWSLGVLLREITTIYGAFSRGEAHSLPALPLQYGDFARWQREWLTGDATARLTGYWANALRDLPALDLPTDHRRPPASTFQGARLPFAVATDPTAQLRRLSRREGSTLFMTLLAAFDVLLAHESGARDFAVGTDVAQRNRPELEGLIGFFVNQLVLRADLSGDPTFRTLLARVRATALDAYAHQDLPFDHLVDRLNPPRLANRTPLFQVKFVLQNAPAPEAAIEGLSIRFLPLDPGTAKFDLLVNVWEQGDGLSGYVEFSTDLFEAPTIERLSRQYAALLADVAADPDLPLSALFDRLTARAREARTTLTDRRREGQRSRLRALSAKGHDERGDGRHARRPEPA